MRDLAALGNFHQWTAAIRILVQVLLSYGLQVRLVLSSGSASTVPWKLTLSECLCRDDLSKVQDHQVHNGDPANGSVSLIASHVAITHTDSLRSLYRRSLKLSLDWCVHRYIWRGQALYIRSVFEANRNVREPRQQRVGGTPLCVW